jgi:yeast amino acid transporter
MVALGEMSAYLPHKKGFAGYATRFVDPAFGFALGWNYLLKYVSIPPLSISHLVC